MLFEVIGENISPGPIGTINYGARQYCYRSKGHVVFKIILATISFIAIMYWYLQWAQAWEIATHLKVIAGFIVYLLVGYYVHPTPDTSNLGWLGGLIDNPFRYSDDLNWLLIWLKLFLFPARLLTYSFIDFVRLILEDANLIKPEGVDNVKKKDLDKKKLLHVENIVSNSEDYAKSEISLVCPNGHNFTVSRLYSGTKRSCSICQEKTQVP